MWVFPLVAAAVAFVFAVLLVKQYVERRRSYQLLWAIALVMYAAASVAVAIGALNGWSRLTFEVYWLFGAVLNVPFLAGGELQLLVRDRTFALVLDVVLVFLVAYAISVVRGATYDAHALAQQLPSGKHVFGDDTSAHHLPAAHLDPVLPGPRRRHALVGVADARPPRAEGPVRRHAAHRDRRDRSSPASARRSPRWASSRCSPYRSSRASS